MNFIDNWGTEVAMLIGLAGSFFILWLSWPERSSGGPARVVWRIAQSAVVMSTVAFAMYMWFGLSGGVWL